tara:strand:+ start:209 stop:385 length:177 start_codon:yes stop_codon:yes gene_type:complete
MAYAQPPTPVDRSDPVSMEKFRKAIRDHKCDTPGCPYCLIKDWILELEGKINEIQSKI